MIPKIFKADGNQVIDTRDGGVCITTPAAGAIAALLNRALHAEKEVESLRALIIEADSQYTKDHQPDDFETASLALVRMCAEGNAALAENVVLRSQLDAANEDAARLYDQVRGAGNLLDADVLAAHRARVGGQK
jgi:hypothetical protein